MPVAMKDYVDADDPELSLGSTGASLEAVISHFCVRGGARLTAGSGDFGFVTTEDRLLPDDDLIPLVDALKHTFNSARALAQVISV